MNTWKTTSSLRLRPGTRRTWEPRTTWVCRSLTCLAAPQYPSLTPSSSHCVPEASRLDSRGVGRHGGGAHRHRGPLTGGWPGGFTPSPPDGSMSADQLILVTCYPLNWDQHRVLTCFVHCSWTRTTRLMRIQPSSTQRKLAGAPWVQAGR